MGAIYNNNVEVLKNNPINIVSVISKVEETDGYVLNDSDNLSFLYDEKYYRLTSENEKNEAKHMVRFLDFAKDNLVLLFGIANIECLKLLREKLNEGTKIVIFEPNLYVLKYILENYDLTEAFSSNQVFLFAGDEEIVNPVIRIYSAIHWSSFVKNIQIITLPNYYLYNNYIKQIINNITDTINLYIKSLGNSLNDIFDGFRNNYLNVEAFMTSNSINEISGQFKNYPAFIIASGPSLDKNIRHLHKAQDKALIITCDASYNACKKNNVKPDAIASIERVEATYKFYYKDKKFDNEMVLVGPGVLWPEILEEYQGKKILMAKSEAGQERWWTSKFDNTEFVNMGFSCAHVAFAVAKRAGCNPVILVGQDLAYTDEKIHSDSTHTEFEGKNEADTKEEIWVEDINGGLVRTNDIYNLFRQWFEHQVAFDENTTIIDATEGGALIKGTVIMTLQGAIDKYCRNDMDKHMVDCLSDISVDRNNKLNKYEFILKDTDQQINILKRLQRKAAMHYKLRDVLEKKQFNKMTEKQLIDLVLKMQKGDKIIREIDKEKYVADFYQQIIKQTIIYVKQIGNELIGENIKRNLQLQMNLMHMVKDSTDLIIAEYEELKRMIESKVGELKAEMAGAKNE